MKKNEYQELLINIILVSTDCIRTSGDADETERIPFVGNPTNSSNFGQ